MFIGSQMARKRMFILYGWEGQFWQITCKKQFNKCQSANILVLPPNKTNKNGGFWGIKSTLIY